MRQGGATVVSLARFRAADPADEIISALQKWGVVLIEDMLSADQLTRINGDLDPHLTQAKPGHDADFMNADLGEFFGPCTRHVTGVVAKSRVFATEILPHPLLRAVCDAILLPGCARYQLNLAHVIDRGPGTERQWLHRDDEGWSVYLPAAHPELQVASVIALADFTAGNGATLVVPGSHRWADRARVAQPAEITVAEMPAGAAIVYLGSTLHAGGANTTTGQWRRGMQVSYALGWLRTEENHYLTIPRDVVRGLPRVAQEMLGYAVHDASERNGGGLGHVNLRDPADLLGKGAL